MTLLQTLRWFEGRFGADTDTDETLSSLLGALGGLRGVSLAFPRSLEGALRKSSLVWMDLSDVVIPSSEWTAMAEACKQLQHLRLYGMACDDDAGLRQLIGGNAELREIVLWHCWIPSSDTESLVHFIQRRADHHVARAGGADALLSGSLVGLAASQRFRALHIWLDDDDVAVLVSLAYGIGTGQFSVPLHVNLALEPRSDASRRVLSHFGVRIRAPRSH